MPQWPVRIISAHNSYCTHFPNDMFDIMTHIVVVFLNIFDVLGCLPTDETNQLDSNRMWSVNVCQLYN